MAMAIYIQESIQQTSSAGQGCRPVHHEVIMSTPHPVMADTGGGNKARATTTFQRNKRLQDQ
jgi:hypothetical protein